MVTVQMAKQATIAALPPSQLRLVQEYQHKALVTRLQEKLELSLAEAQQLFEDTKLFLYFCHIVPGRWSPSEMIDEGWHNFILFTKDYAEFNQRFFGKFLHHQPKIAGLLRELSPNDTLVTAEQIFGQPLSRNWVDDAPKAVCCRDFCCKDG